ncbi:MAG: ABC transporter permease [Bacillota bacterium]|jgi:ribose transport system permease protein|nr:ABC transporter permease [Bacillota bacterium]
MRKMPGGTSSKLSGAKSAQLLTLGLFAVMCVVFAFLSPVFLTSGNLLNIARQTAMLAIMCFGMVVVLIATGGEADMSIAGVTGFASGVVVTLLARGASTFVAIVAALAAGTASGLLNGMLVTKIGLLPFLATLATSNMAQGLEQVLTKGTAVAFSDPFIAHLANGDTLGIPTSLFLVLGVFLVFYVVLDHTGIGRRLYAVGGNPQVARMAGVDVDMYKTMAFVVAGLCSGIAGIVLMGRLSGLTPLAATHMHLDVLLAGYVSTVLSTVGAPGIFGALFGAVLVGTLTNGLAVIRVPTFYVNLVKGLLIIVVVAANAIQRRRRRSA